MHDCHITIFPHNFSLFHIYMEIIVLYQKIKVGERGRVVAINGLTLENRVDYVDQLH